MPPEAFVGLDDAFLEAASLPPQRASTGSGASNRMPTELDADQICNVWGYFLSEETPNGGWFTQEDRDGLLKYLEEKVHTTQWQLFVSPFTGETAMDCPLLRVRRVADVTIQINEWEHTYIRTTKLVQQNGWSFTESKNTAQANKAIKDSCADFFKLHAIICHQMFSGTQQHGAAGPKSGTTPEGSHRITEVTDSEPSGSSRGGIGGTFATTSNRPESGNAPKPPPSAPTPIDRGKKRKMSEADIDQGGYDKAIRRARLSTPHPYKKTRRAYLYESRSVAQEPIPEAEVPTNSAPGEDPAVAIARYQYLSRKAELDFQLEMQKLEMQKQREEREARYKAEEADKQRHFELEKLRLEIKLQALRLKP
ncbi:hypothetical protein TWF718_007918 [Orbilia javanica]|uniref:Uncharacterized protein n=1 Tax=Orbilia javanica TaxID=47235 RepID=A0AAN8MMD2_9PEZI